MALPIVPLITAGASILGNLFNTKSVKQTNQRQQDFNTQMYERQRADALADFDKQNLYNSPSQQMQRFKEAGLNPNLIYGQMSNSPVIRSTDAKSPDFVAPKLETGGITNALMQYYDIKQKEASIRQQDQATELLKQQTQGKKLENQNLIDQSPYIAEEKFQRSRLVGQQVNSIMEDVYNKKLMNPLLRDKVSNDIQTMTQNRLWQNLTTPQQIQISKVTTKLIESKLAGQDIENTFRKYTNNLQQDLGINSNLLSDLLKIGIGSLLNK
jgi:hypothetical protein